MMVKTEDNYTVNSNEKIEKTKRKGFREFLYQIIFGGDSTAHEVFDVVLIIIIILSVVTVMFDSVTSIEQKYGEILFIAEWVFTILFTIEYIIRLICSRKRSSYIFSFFGLVDLLSVAPTYISLLVPGSHILIVIRVLRVLRIFRVLKLVKFVGESDLLIIALMASRRKITVFLFCIMTIVVIFGSIMYTIEGQENGFTSIPHSIYWAVVTLTTVGYGDVTPKTGFGQALSAIIMIMGYGIIAVPTGIVTAEITSAMGHNRGTSRSCRNCNSKWHDDDARFCKHCGVNL